MKPEKDCSTLNCDNRAIAYVDWFPQDYPQNGGTKQRTYLCGTCVRAFELGQELHVKVEYIEE